MSYSNRHSPVGKLGCHCATLKYRTMTAEMALEFFYLLNFHFWHAAAGKDGVLISAGDADPVAGYAHFPIQP